MSATSTGSEPPAASRAPGKTRGAARGRWALLAVLVAAVALAGWIIWSAHAEKGAEGGGRGRGGGRGGFGGATSVNAARTTTGDMPVYIDALGTVTPPATVTVRTQVAGQLLSVAFREGQDVTKGQLLAQVDPRPYQAALAQAQGALARDEAQLANARLDLTRYTTLLQQDSIARQTADTQRATVRQLEGTVEADRGSVQSARVNLGYTRITAPVSGRVGLRQVDPGNYVSNGDTNGLVTITTIHPIDAVFTVPEDEVATVQAHSGGGARLAATAFDRTNTQALDEGYLLTLDNQIDTTTGTVKAKARFPNTAGKLFPNQFVNVRLLVDTLRGVVLAPTSAILRGQNGLFVWTVDPDRTVHQRYIKAGPAAGESTAVTSGLQPGETLVTDGSDRLREGGEVLLPGDCPPPDVGGRGGRHGGGGQGGGRRHGGAGRNGAGATPGVGPDGGRCTPTAVSTGAGGAQRGQQRMQAMLAQLNLDPAQKAKVDAIVATDQPKMRAAFQSGDFATAMRLRQEMTAAIEAVLRPDQRAKYQELQQQQRSQFRGGGGPNGALPPATPQPQSPPPAGGEPSPAQRARGGAPSADLPPAAAPTAASGPRGSLKGPPPAASATSPSTVGGAVAPAGDAGRPGGGGRGRMAALLDQLKLDPGQRARVDAIVADDQPKMRAAFGSGDMAAAAATRQDMTRRIEAVLRPDQRARYAQLRAQMRSDGGGGGPPGGG